MNGVIIEIDDKVQIYSDVHIGAIEKNIIVNNVLIVSKMFINDILNFYKSKK